MIIRACRIRQGSIEKVVASLENGTNAFAFSSGMAAISLLMEIFRPNDHIIADSDLYGGISDCSAMFRRKTVFNFQALTAGEKISRAT